MERMSTGRFGNSARIVLINSSPRAPAKPISAITRSGPSSRTSAIASTAVLASPQTTNSSFESIRRTRPLRKTGWSSTKMMRFAFCLVAISGRLAFQPLHGKASDLTRILQIQFFFDVGTMGLDRLGANVQRARNLANIASFPNQFENLQLTIAQLVGRIGLIASACEIGDQFR